MLSASAKIPTREFLIFMATHPLDYSPVRKVLANHRYPVPPLLHAFAECNKPCDLEKDHPTSPDLLPQH